MMTSKTISTIINIAGRLEGAAAALAHDDRADGNSRKRSELVSLLRDSSEHLMRFTQQAQPTAISVGDGDKQ